MTAVPFSFELFPPRTPAVAARMPDVARQLGALGPEFISVTFGAGGSSRKESLGVLELVRDLAGVRPLAHLTCVGATTAELSALIGEFIDRGIRDFLALRGDKPAEAEGDEWLGEIRTGAELAQLVRGVRRTRIPEELERVTPTDGRWRVRDARGGIIAVAAYPTGHPESRGEQQDLDTLLAKEAAGANLAITQLFFEADDYLRFVERARAHGVTIPILPGIMPITSIARLNRMAQLSGEPVPQRWQRALESCTSDAARKELGIAQATAMCHDLLDGGAPGLHLYTQNRVSEPVELLCRVGAVDRARAEALLAKQDPVPESSSSAAFRMLMRSH